MENKNETKYFFIWLYISLLLHLLMVIIMLTIKSGKSLSLEPDPTHQQIDPAQVIFITDELQSDNNATQPYQMAKRNQGSEHGNTDEKRALTENNSSSNMIDDQDDIDIPKKDNKLDTVIKALTDEFKKGLKDETIVKEQLLADESIQEKVSATPAIQGNIESEQIQPESKLTEKEIIDPSTKKLLEDIDPIDIFNKLIEEKKTLEKQDKQSAIIQSKYPLVEPIQKIESKKHRPIEIGLQNQSKLELTKNINSNESSAPQKRKLSLQDLNLQQGFSEFVRKGNATFSSDGNSNKDDEMGLKIASYMTQISKTHENAFKSYPNKFIIKHHDQIPPHDSIINMIIDQSGQVTLVRLQSSGNQTYDDYHMKVLIFMGNFNRIPKFLIDTATSFPVKSILYTATNTSSFGNYQPGKLEL